MFLENCGNSYDFESESNVLQGSLLRDFEGLDRDKGIYIYGGGGMEERGFEENNDRLNLFMLY